MSDKDIQAADQAIDEVELEELTPVIDLRAAAAVIEGRHVADSVRMLVVPGSARVRLQAESEGLDVVFKDAGAEWRAAGCSMCLGMNPDQLAPGQRCASTSNRNFEGRQGRGGRTHLLSPVMAAGTSFSAKWVVASATRSGSSIRSREARSRATAAGTSR